MKTIYLVMEYLNEITSECSAVESAWTKIEDAESRRDYLNGLKDPYFHYGVEQAALDGSVDDL